MLFSWDDLNREHIAKHNVSPEEAEQVVQAAFAPFPRAIGDGKYMVWGLTSLERYLQVIFVFKRPEELDYESLSPEQWQIMEAEKIARVIRVIHAMDLTEKMKRSFRRIMR